jgi:hypothetical protein
MSNLTLSDGSIPTAEIILSDSSGLTDADGRALFLTNMTNVTVDNLDLSYSGGSRSGSGLIIDNSTNIIISHSTATNRNDGFNFSGGSDLTVSCTSIKNSNNGMQVNSTNVILSNNHIAGNTTGLNNLSASLVNAENNYWGAADGPVTLGGSGDSYIGSVDASPFLTAVPGPPDCSMSILSVVDQGPVKGSSTIYLPLMVK